MNELVQERLAAGEFVVAGVLSGTSADGIDVGLARFSNSAGLTLEESLGFETRAFDAEVAERVQHALRGESLPLREVALLDRDLGRAFGSAVRSVAEERGVRVDLVGSHGQTLYHHDGEEIRGRATLQLGDGDEVALAAGAPCAFDFRRADIAAGGEGAPLSPLADSILFRKAPRPLTILNLGGFANLTWLGEAGEVRAFDTGPANVWLDHVAREFLRVPFDERGREAARGSVHAGLLEALLAAPFFDRAPPKSTGRDHLGAAYFDACRAPWPELSPCDLLRTAITAVAESVASARERWLPEAASPLYVAGGGVHNETLLAALGEALGRQPASTAELGVEPDAREALVFATLGAARAAGLPLTRSGTTGAPEGILLGKLAAPGGIPRL